MQNLLVFLDGKKAVILAIASAILSYVVATGMIEASLGALLQTIVSLLAGGAVVITNSAIKNETGLGVALVNNRINNK